MITGENNGPAVHASPFRMLPIVAATLVCASRTAAQCPIDWLPGEGHPGITGDGPVSSMTIWDPDGAGPQGDVLVVAGGFEGAGDVAAGRIATWDGAEWRALGPAPGITGQVWALAIYNGDLIAAGNMSAAGGVPVSMIARFDGESWHPLGSGISPYPVRALAVFNGELYAGGLFTSAGGVAVNGIARWNGSIWQSLGSGLSPGAGVTALTVFEKQLIVGGGFTSAGGVPATRFASWDGASWQSMDGGIVHASAPDELAVYNGQLIAGANIFSSGGSFLRSISRWDAQSSTWQPLGPGNATPNDVVTELIEYDGDLYAGGVFTSAGGVSTPTRMARWDGSAWFAIPFGPGVPHRAVGAFAVFNGDLIAGGTASKASGLAESAVGRWDGSAWHYMGGGVNFVVLATAEFQGDTYIGGAFNHAGDIVVSSIARRRSDGTWDDLLGGITGHPDGPIVGSMAVFDNSLLVSGLFTHAGGVPVNGIARWDGKAWSAFGSEFAGDLVVLDGELYGMIAPIIPNTSQVAKWNPLTESWQPLGLLPSNAVVLGLTLFNGDLIAGGAGFGAAPAAVYRWDGATWHPMGGTFGINAIQALAVYNGELIAGGVYDGSNGPPGGIIRWNPATSSWTTFQGGLFDDDTENFTYGVWDMVVRDNELIIAGVFSHLGAAFGIEGDNIARWNGSTWACLGEGTNDHIVDLSQGDQGLILGGWFTMAGGTPNGHFARWGPQCPPGDITGDGVVNIDDLLAVIAAWGPCPAPPAACSADVNHDHAVNIDDLLQVISHWG